MKHERLFFLDVLPCEPTQILELTESFWSQKNENLWIGKIPFEIISTDYEDFVLTYLSKYFQEKKYLLEIEKIKVDSGQELIIELVCKTAYLVNEYLNNGNFNDPLCTHYNPRLDKHVIHPGGTRQIVLDLFHRGEINSFYFNTRGYEFDFMKNLKLCNLKDYAKHDDFYMSLVPDHGSLIPHILRRNGVKKNPENMIKAHNYIKSRLVDPNFKIFCNKNIDFLKPWKTSSKQNANVKIYFRDSNPSTKNIIKAVYLFLAGRNYKNKHIQVRHAL